MVDIFVPTSEGEVKERGLAKLKSMARNESSLEGAATQSTKNSMKEIMSDPETREVLANYMQGMKDRLNKFRR